jgi:uncharacterized coiled-coil DUF342 family protein
MILTNDEIELKVSQIRGTHIKRNNLRKKLKEQSNNLVNEKIDECKGKIRDLRAMAATEETLRFWYTEVTNLELKLL